MKGDLRDVDSDSSEDDSEEEQEQEVVDVSKKGYKFSTFSSCVKHIIILLRLPYKYGLFIFIRAKSRGLGGMFGMLKGLVGSKTLSLQDLEPALDKMKDHLIGMFIFPPLYT